MTNRSFLFSVFSVTAIFFLFLTTACTHPEKDRKKEGESQAIAWWKHKNPLHIKGYVFALSCEAKRKSNNEPTKKARQKAAKILEGEILTLVEYYPYHERRKFKKYNNPSYYLDNNYIRKKIIKQILEKAPILSRHRHDNTTYILLAIPLDLYEEKMESILKKQFDTLILTDVIKVHTAKRLTKMLARQKEKLSQRFQYKVKKGQILALKKASPGN